MLGELFKERRVGGTVHGLGTKVHDKAPICCGLNTVTAATPWLHRHADVSHATCGSAQQRCDRLGNNWDLNGGEASEVDAAARHKINRLLVAKSLQLRVIKAEQ